MKLATTFCILTCAAALCMAAFSVDVYDEIVEVDTYGYQWVTATLTESAQVNGGAFFIRWTTKCGWLIDADSHNGAGGIAWDEVYILTQGYDEEGGYAYIQCFVDDGYLTVPSGLNVLFRLKWLAGSELCNCTVTVEDGSALELYPYHAAMYPTAMYAGQLHTVYPE